MILKEADDKNGQISKLEELLSKCDSSLHERIRREISIVRAGIKGEKDSAYLLDFYFKDRRKSVVMHDLRIEISGRIAQIDHLIINEAHRFYVLETKHFKHGLKINEFGEYSRWNEWRKSYEGMASPVEQNNRHVEVLRDALMFIGMKRPAAFLPFVLVSSEARIDRAPGVRVPEVVKADQFMSAYKADLNELAEGNVLKVLGAAARITLGTSPQEIGEKLLELHTPLEINYEAKFAMQSKKGFMRRASDQQNQIDSLQLKKSEGDSKFAPKITCAKCSSTKLRVEYGRYGYYFKCQACDVNKPIKIGCGVESHNERIRKQGVHFYRECSQCESSSLFFENDR